MSRPPLDNDAVTFELDIVREGVVRSPLPDTRLVISDDRATSDMLGTTIVAITANTTVKPAKERRGADMVLLTIERENNHL